MTPRLACVVALAAPLLSGCGAMHVRATVTTARSPSATSAGSTEPLAGASVSMFCPQVLKGNGWSLLGQTDANGELELNENPLGRWIHDGCDIVIERVGFQTKRFRVTDVCKEYSGNHCVRAVVVAELVKKET